ncbi:hypothetical protein CLOM_g3349 [Closterium sp. NIES-68]|nr:hypothetical protein CLOM_g3349 [Closterium sp. NIES-68]GJP67054.1 hypothetical protein CLOP_g23926 [Closterium sp. NIES-67]GJP81629.1 hypothetical protein CLOP_g11785 [Closterium sp. NIES-67]
MGGPHETLGGILHGFSADLLARAWDVEEEEARRVVAGQKHVGFVAVGHHNARRLTGELQAMMAGEDEASGTEEAMDPNALAHMRMGDISPFTRFKYSLSQASPDMAVPKGGDIFAVDRSKLPVLHHVGLSAFLYHLQPNALLAPHWYPNAAILHVVLAGSGRIEVVYPDGRTALHRDVHTGDVIAVPALFPSSMEASAEGMMWIAIANRPISPPSFLAGITSVFKGIPKDVLVAAFNVDEALEDKFYKARRDPSEIAIFPPTDKSAA